MGALSSRQLVWAGSALGGLGVLIISRGGIFPGLVLCIIQFVTELRTTPAPDDKVYTAADRMAELKMFGWFAVFVFGIILFGFPYAAPLIVALYLHFSWNEKWYVSLGAAAFAWVILHGVFDYVLGLPLFEGLVYRWIWG